MRTDSGCSDDKKGEKVDLPILYFERWWCGGVLCEKKRHKKRS